MTYREKYTWHPINSFRKAPISSRLIGISASLRLFHCALLMLSLNQSDVFYIMIKNNLYVPVTLQANAAVLIGSIEPILEAQHKHSAAGAQLWRNERSCHFLFVGRISLYSVIKGECTMQHWANAESTEEDAFSFKCHSWVYLGAEVASAATSNHERKPPHYFKSFCKGGRHLKSHQRSPDQCNCISYLNEGKKNGKKNRKKSQRFFVYHRALRLSNRLLYEREESTLVYSKHSHW